jgi:catechol 2,3-dioxygenase-like lactoylglutathione lyase family enzyme
MAKLGLNHIDLATKDMRATRAFYEDVMGFKLVRADIVEVVGEGKYQHYFFDVGNGQLIAFFSGENVENYPKDFDSGINDGLGLRKGAYHFAFEAGTEEELDRVKAQLESKGVAVNGPFDHEGWSKSIYFEDPNGLQMEYCWIMREFTAEDAIPAVRFHVDRDGVKHDGPSSTDA